MVFVDWECWKCACRNSTNPIQSTLSFLSFVSEKCSSKKRLRKIYAREWPKIPSCSECNKVRIKEHIHAFGARKGKFRLSNECLADALQFLTKPNLHKLMRIDKKFYMDIGQILELHCPCSSCKNARTKRQIQALALPKGRFRLSNDCLADAFRFLTRRELCFMEHTCYRFYRVISRHFARFPLHPTTFTIQSMEIRASSSCAEEFQLTLNCTNTDSPLRFSSNQAQILFKLGDIPLPCFVNVIGTKSFEIGFPIWTSTVVATPTEVFRAAHKYIKEFLPKITPHRLALTLEIHPRFIGFCDHSELLAALQKMLDIFDDFEMYTVRIGSRKGIKTVVGDSPILGLKEYLKENPRNSMPLLLHPTLLACDQVRLDANEGVPNLHGFIFSFDDIVHWLHHKKIGGEKVERILTIQRSAYLIANISALFQRLVKEFNCTCMGSAAPYRLQIPGRTNQNKSERNCQENEVLTLGEDSYEISCRKMFYTVIRRRSEEAGTSTS